MPQPMSTPTAAGMIALWVGDHRADGRADAQVHVGHGGDMVVDDGQLGQVDQLPPCEGIQVVGPDLDRSRPFHDDLLDGRPPGICFFQPSNRLNRRQNRRLLDKFPAPKEYDYWTIALAVD